MNTVKSNFSQSPDARATRFDLDVLTESDFSTSDPPGNQREPLNQFPFRRFGYFMGPYQRENCKASKPPDQGGVPGVEEVSLFDTDERRSKGGY